MPGTVTREEFDELADEVRGEKTVTRHILEQTRRNSDDLAALKTRMARVEEKVDGLTADVGGLRGEVGGLRAELHGLRDAIPGIVRDVMREVLNERGL